MQLDNQYGLSTYTGTGSALTVTLGFKPIFVLIYDTTSGTTLDFWFQGLAAANHCSIVTTAGPALVTSNGITATSTGFTVGTASSINTNAHVYQYIAF